MISETATATFYHIACTIRCSMQSFLWGHRASYGLIWFDYWLLFAIKDTCDLSNYKGMKSIHASSFFQSVEGLTHRNTQPFRITSNHNPNACLQTVRGSREKTCRTPHRKPQLSRGFKPRTFMLWGDKVNHCFAQEVQEMKWNETKTFLQTLKTCYIRKPAFTGPGSLVWWQ